MTRAIDRLRTVPDLAWAAIGITAVIAAWWIIADTGFAETGVVPSPAALVAQVAADGPAYYLDQITTTLASAATGYAWGAGIALLAASVVIALPRIEPFAAQFGLLVECIPLAAIGPIVLALVGGRTPSIFLAAMSVFFVTLIGSLLGIHATRRIEHDLIAVYGGGRWARFKKLQAIAALPAALTALKVAVPAAMLGAIIGEYLGGVDSGIGVALSVAQRSIQVERTWLFGLGAALIALAGYGILALVHRTLLPWAHTAGGAK